MRRRRRRIASQAIILFTTASFGAHACGVRL